jgi:tetratricopeptide (TPR) repeat protein
VGRRSALAASELAKDRAIAYYNRGARYQLKADRDRAIADYSEAIRLDPEFALA